MTDLPFNPQKLTETYKPGDPLHPLARIIDMLEEQALIRITTQHKPLWDKVAEGALIWPSAVLKTLRPEGVSEEQKIAWGGLTFILGVFIKTVFCLGVEAGKREARK
jgi:hypothetical protein